MTLSNHIVRARLSSLALAVAALVVACGSDEDALSSPPSRGVSEQIAEAEQIDTGVGVDVVTASNPNVGADLQWVHSELVPMLPSEPARFAPSHALTEGIGHEELARMDDCASCHAGVAREWERSAHGFSSFSNPYYRMGVEAFVEAEGPDAAQHCAGCHDPTLLFAEVPLDSVLPEDPLAHSGVTCTTCHAREESLLDGNGSYTLRDQRPRTPMDGVTVEEHRDQIRIDTELANAVCVSCHRGFVGPDVGVPNHMAGIGDVEAWQGSAYATETLDRLEPDFEAQDCVSCHMPINDEGRRSHDFIGAHTAMRSGMGDERGLRLTQELLQTSLWMDLMLVDAQGIPHAPETWTPVPGETVMIDVVIRNVGAGHSFPAGVRDLLDTWLEFEVLDPSGNTVAGAGLGYAEDGADGSAWRFGTLVVDEEGNPLTLHQVHDFGTSVWDHTIPARGTQVVRYSWTVPDTAASGEYSVSARVRHRARPLPFQAAVCDAYQSERGQAFARVGEEFLVRSIDPCIELPVTDVATSLRSIGGHEVADNPQQRFFLHGQGLARDRQELLSQAVASFERALELTDSEWSRAMTHDARGRLLGRMGRTDDALVEFAAAESLVGPQAAISYARGRSLAQVWRWEEARDAYAVAAELAPDAWPVWRGYAEALGSVMEDEQSLAAAQRGLAFHPREPSLLRSQFLALQGLGEDEQGIAEARQAWLSVREWDRRLELRGICAQEVENCARDRLPVPVIELD